MIDFLLHQLPAAKDEGFAYFHRNQNEVDRNDPKAILLAILKQLAYVKANCIHLAAAEYYLSSKREGFSGGDP